MRFGSVCSGIEAASVAWKHLGWRASFLSEIEPFPCAVIAHHYPKTPNFGDMTKFKDWPDASIDVLCGGTPCQSFSVAGLRAGLADPRGNLMLTFGAIADRYRPRWLVWENVPGVLSSNGGRDFGAFLRLLGQLGYGFAYRVFDAQYAGLAQRRKRVFVVGCLGDWRSAAAVLFERHSLSGHPAPSREAGEGVAGTITGGASLGGMGPGGRTDGASQGHINVVATLDANYGRLQGASGQDASHGHSHLVSMCLNAKGGAGRLDAESETLIPTTGAGFDVAHSLRGEGFDASEDGTGRGTPLVPIHFGGSSFPTVSEDGGSPTLTSRRGDRSGVMRGSRVRRLTPRECERLQGFPDDYTLIPLRNAAGKPSGKCSKDGPRYKALGNSWAVPVVRWIGKRIAAVDAIKLKAAA